MKHAAKIREECKASQVAKDKASKLKKEVSSLKKSNKAKDKELFTYVDALKKAQDELWAARTQVDELRVELKKAQDSERVVTAYRDEALKHIDTLKS